MKFVRHDEITQSSTPEYGADVVLYVDHINTTDRSVIKNIVTNMVILDTGNQLFPVSINEGFESNSNCYVVSPLTTYSGYAEEELKRLNKPWLTWPLTQLVRGVGILLKSARIDRIVQVNNWLLSTNLYPPAWDGSDLPQMTDFLKSSFPDHVFGFRSLNAFSNSSLLIKLKELGYLSIPSRQVYIFDGRNGMESEFINHHNFKIDMKLIDHNKYKVVYGNELKESDFPRLEELYNLLYLEKYCRLNPQYTAEWMQCGQRDGWLELQALRNIEGRIDGVVGWFSTKGILTAPIVGYDTSLPKKTGLYRQLTNMCLQQAAERQVVLNFSSGAAHFKRLRGGQPEIEYSMLYIGHLPIHRRIVWILLSKLLHGIGVPLMRKLKL